MALREIVPSSDLLRADTRAHAQSRNANHVDEALPLSERSADDARCGRLLLEHFLIVGILLATVINAVLHDPLSQRVPHNSHGILARLTSEPGPHPSHVVGSDANGQNWGAFAPPH